MTKSLKEAVLEIVEITKGVPEPLQLRCFELLLSHHLAKDAPARSAKKEIEKEPDKDEEREPGDEKPETQADIQNADLHVKAKKFLEKYALTLGDLNEILFKEGEDFKPLFDDLKTTKLAESQIRIALLEALKAGLKSGDFEFNGEAVRSQCQAKKCYDKANFAAIFTKNAAIFEGFESYKKENPIKLNESGKKRLADLIKELKA